MTSTASSGTSQSSEGISPSTPGDSKNPFDVKVLYDQLGLLATTDPLVLDYLFSKIRNVKEVDMTARSLFEISQQIGTIVPLMKVLLRIEFQKMDGSETVLRGNTLTTKIADLLIKNITKEFISETLKYCISKTLETGLDLEIDATKLPNYSNEEVQKALIDKNLQALNDLTQDYIDVIITSVTEVALPIELKCLAKFVKEFSEECKLDPLPILGNLIMLRIFNPSIIFPERNNLLTTQPVSPIGRRNLILISKILQNLANRVQFGIKEGYMTPLNSLILENQRKIDDYFMSVIASDNEYKCYMEKQEQITQAELKKNAVYSQCYESVLKIHEIIVIYLDKFHEVYKDINTNYNNSIDNNIDNNNNNNNNSYNKSTYSNTAFFINNNNNNNTSGTTTLTPTFLQSSSAVTSSSSSLTTTTTTTDQHVHPLLKLLERLPKLTKDELDAVEKTPDDDVNDIPKKQPIPPSEYEKCLAKAKSLDFSSVEKAKVLSFPGTVDINGLPVVVFFEYHLRGLDLELVFYYAVKVLDPFVKQDYALIYCVDNTPGATKLPFSWLLNAYKTLTRNFKKNLKAFYVLHPGFLLRALFNFFRPFVSKKFWQKLHFLDRATEIFVYVDRGKIILPPMVLHYDHTTYPMKPQDLDMTRYCGISIKDILDRKEEYGRKIPRYYNEMINYVENNGLEVLGIFRIASRTDEIKSFVAMVDYGDDIDYELCNLFVVANSLKYLLKELDAPLLSYERYTDLMGCLELGDNKERQFNEIQKVLVSLKWEFELIKALFGLFYKIHLKGDINKMTAQNLSVVFANILLRPPNGNMLEQLQQNSSIEKLISLLITEYPSIFPVQRKRRENIMQLKQ